MRSKHAYMRSKYFALKRIPVIFNVGTPTGVMSGDVSYVKIIYEYLALDSGILQLLSCQHLLHGECTCFSHTVIR